MDDEQVERAAKALFEEDGWRLTWEEHLADSMSEGESYREKARACLAAAGEGEREDRAGWKWHGRPGHFICADDCCFRLHTTVGRYRVSSVGCLHHKGDESGKPQNVGAGRLYETMVFPLDADGEVVEWSEIDSDAYNDEAAAEAGHIRMCEKWSRAALAARPSTEGDEEARIATAQEERDAWKQEAEESREIAEQLRREVSQEEPVGLSRVREMMTRIPAVRPSTDEKGNTDEHS